MTAEILKREINRFLNDPTPEVLAIKGMWGVRKTNSWSKVLQNTYAKNQVKLRKYSYAGGGPQKLDNVLSSESIRK